MMSISHNKQYLPSLRAICAIEAAARLGSFTGAALELNVTQGAISRQIQELERRLCVELFVRAGPKLTLTETGRSFAESAKRALDILSEAVKTAHGYTAPNHITLSMLPSVAAKWLAPRLGRFIHQHPDIDLRISASRNFVNFEADGIDAAIRYGKGKWVGLNAVLLARETIFPVCTPAYAKRLNLTTPAELTRAVLFHADFKEDWETWFKAAGVANVGVLRGPALGDDAAILQAVIDGQGVALGRSVLVSDDLAAGRLIAPFDIKLAASFSYWLVSPAPTIDSPNLTTVKEWVQAGFNSSSIQEKFQ